MRNRLRAPIAKASRSRVGRRGSAGLLGAVRPAEMLSYALAGLTLGTASIVGVHYLGQDADARTRPDSAFISLDAPLETLEERALAGRQRPIEPPALRLRVISNLMGKEDRLALQRVARLEKGDLLMERPLRDAGMTVSVNDRLLRTPPVWKLEKSWRLARIERRRLLAARKRRLRERMCLAKAIYFEARSESIKGQMAVAEVILNRVRDPRFPNTVCGVVYQGAERRNACQFSFACDGKPDYPTNARQWRLARQLAARALRGKVRLRGFEGVAFYHADYVRPNWASMMRPVIKIGRHIFYRDS